MVGSVAESRGLKSTGSSAVLIAHSTAPGPDTQPVR